MSSQNKFLIYANSNCVDFREDAFDAIALSNPWKEVNHVSGCAGNMKNLTNVRKSFSIRNQSRGTIQSNWKFLRDYQFCLVMENIYLEGYITEKIVLAFAIGCIP